MSTITTRALVARLLDIQHAHHALIVSTTHVHLDHDGCLESIMLRGPVTEVRALAERVRAERGVRFGALNLISAAAAGRATDNGRVLEGIPVMRAARDDPAVRQRNHAGLKCHDRS